MDRIIIMEKNDEIKIIMDQIKINTAKMLQTTRDHYSIV